jgi:uncharacterized UPF0146 family protein
MFQWQKMQSVGADSVQGGGNLGPSVVKELLDANFNITALTRIGSTANFHPHTKVVATNYSPQSLREIFEGQDAVISLVGAAGLDEQKNIIDVAAQVGVTRFIPSEFGNDTTQPENLRLVPLYGQKKEVVDYLKTKQSAGMTWTAVINGCLLDWVSIQCFACGTS